MEKRCLAPVFSFLSLAQPIFALFFMTDIESSTSKLYSYVFTLDFFTDPLELKKFYFKLIFANRQAPIDFLQEMHYCVQYIHSSWCPYVIQKTCIHGIHVMTKFERENDRIEQ